MSFEKVVLSVVKCVTSVPAYFYEGTMFLESQDSKIATQVFNALCEEITPAIVYSKVGAIETSYDFVYEAPYFKE
jgi:hypothetical protein